MWLWLALSSGLVYGFYDIFRKKALLEIPLLHVLALYSFCSFLLVSFDLRNALQIEAFPLSLVALKSLLIFIGWIFGFMALRSLPISIAAPLDTLTPLFTVLLGVIALHERLGLWQVCGVAIILGAYYLIGKAGNQEIGGIWKNKFFYLLMGSASLNAISALMDKYILKRVNVGQMQFWFCLFLTVLYCGALTIVRFKRNDRSPLRFHWMIVGMSLFLVAADRLYFQAVNAAASQIAIILPLRRVSVLESSILGGIHFKEKNLKAKFGGICLVLLGILIIFLGKAG